jgi:hypothetical protein
VIFVGCDSCSVDHGGQPSGLILRENLQSFNLQVAPLQLRLVILLWQKRPNQERQPENTSRPLRKS